MASIITVQNALNQIINSSSFHRDQVEKRKANEEQALDTTSLLKASNYNKRATIFLLTIIGYTTQAVITKNEAERTQRAVEFVLTKLSDTIMQTQESSMTDFDHKYQITNFNIQEKSSKENQVRTEADQAYQSLQKAIDAFRQACSIQGG